MKRPPSKRPGPQVRRSSKGSTTSQERPTAALVAAMMQVTRYRFTKFLEAFGRIPEPNEPLFFLEGLPFPALAGEELVLEQLSEAARATGVDFKRLKEWLNLA